MNEHEAERIAAAVHVARPDWPKTSLLTLIRKHLIDRPRRDVFVALAWVASEPATHTPARVLESGPWWRAAGVEGGHRPLNQVPKHRRCAVCSLDRDDCARVWDDHEFRLPRDLKRDPDVIHQIVEATKAELQPTRPLPDLAPVSHDPRAEAARDAMHPTEPPTPAATTEESHE